jgi:integrase
MNLLFKTQKISNDLESYFLSNEDVNNICNNIEIKRDCLIFRFLYQLGCSIYELVKIRRGDISFEDCIIIIKSSKTQRKCIISKELLEDLKKYLFVENKINLKRSYIFSVKKNLPLTQRRVYQIVKTNLDKMGYVPNPSLIRYSHIYNAYKCNVPLNIIHKQVGLSMGIIYQIISLDNYNENVKYETFFET